MIAFSSAQQRTRQVRYARYLFSDLIRVGVERGFVPGGAACLSPWGTLARGALAGGRGPWLALALTHLMDVKGVVLIQAAPTTKRDSDHVSSYILHLAYSSKDRESRPAVHRARRR